MTRNSDPALASAIALDSAECSNFSSAHPFIATCCVTPSMRYPSPSSPVECSPRSPSNEMAHEHNPPGCAPGLRLRDALPPPRRSRARGARCRHCTCGSANSAESTARCVPPPSTAGPTTVPRPTSTELYLPAVFCRHCGRSGWGARLAPTGSALDVTDEAIRADHAAGASGSAR